MHIETGEGGRLARRETRPRGFGRPEMRGCGGDRRKSCCAKVADGRENVGPLEDEDSVVPVLSFQHKVAEIVENQLERIDTAIDEVLGKRKKPVGPAPAETRTKRRRLDKAVLDAELSEKPQALFSRPPDNDRISVSVSDQFP